MEEAVSKMLEIVRELEPGTRASIACLAHEAGVDICPLDEFELDAAFREACSCAGILVDDEGGLDAGARRPGELVFRPALNPSPTPFGLKDVSALVFAERAFPDARRVIRLAWDGDGFACETELGVAGQTLAPARKRLGSRYEAVISKGLVESGVCGWEREYAAAEVMDGECWELRIVLHDGRAVASDGRNSYPEGYEALKCALSKVGKAAFR